MNRSDWLDDYLLAKPGCTKDYKQEWGWWRYQVGGKLFAAICTPGPEHKGYDCRELITLKCDPLLSETLRSEHADVTPGFYMDKRNWNSVFLDGDLPKEILCELCDHSYALVFQRLTRKLQKEITGEKTNAACKNEEII